MKTYGLSGTSAPAPAAPTQDLDRHAPKPQANHLTLPEQAKHDARNLERDLDALKRMQAARPTKPPGRRV